MDDEGIRGSEGGDGLGKGKVKHIDDDRIRDNRRRMVVRGSVNIVFVGKSIGGIHLRTRSDDPFNIEILEEEQPTSLSVREFLRVLDIR